MLVGYCMLHVFVQIYALPYTVCVRKLLFLSFSVGLVSFHVDCDRFDKLNWSLTLTKSNSYTLDLLACFVRRKKTFFDLNPHTLANYQQQVNIMLEIRLN